MGSSITRAFVFRGGCRRTGADLARGTSTRSYLSAPPRGEGGRAAAAAGPGSSVRRSQGLSRAFTGSRPRPRRPARQARKQGDRRPKGAAAVSVMHSGAGGREGGGRERTVREGKNRPRTDEAPRARPTPSFARGRGVYRVTHAKTPRLPSLLEPVRLPTSRAGTLSDPRHTRC